MFLVNSRPGQFSAIPLSLAREEPHLVRHLFFRSYEIILPSSLTRALSSTLGFSPHLPVSVCGTDIFRSRLEVFLGSVVPVSWFGKNRISHSLLGVMIEWICLPNPPTSLDQGIQHLADFPFCVTPSLRRSQDGTGMFARFPSPTPLGLSLGSD